MYRRLGKEGDIHVFYTSSYRTHASSCYSDICSGRRNENSAFPPWTLEARQYPPSTHRALKDAWMARYETASHTEGPYDYGYKLRTATHLVWLFSRTFSCIGIRSSSSWLYRVGRHGLYTRNVSQSYRSIMFPVRPHHHCSKVSSHSPPVIAKRRTNRSSRQLRRSLQPSCMGLP